MSFVQHIGVVPDEQMEKFREQARVAEWEIVAGRAYQTSFIEPPEGCRLAFFLKLPPHSAIHKHVDAGDCKTDRIVIQSNKDCANYWVDEDRHVFHMTTGHRYLVDRTVLHWAENNGDTDRIHLLLEY